MVRIDPISGIEQRYSVERVQPFVDARILKTDQVPTRHQVRMAAFRMVPDVISPYDDEPLRYGGTELGPYPVKRFLHILREIGIGQADSTAGFAICLNAVAKHTLLTLHPGVNPVYDLQLMQTHPGGLDYFEELTKRVYGREDDEAKRISSLAERIIPNPMIYHRRMFDFIAQAREFEYPTDQLRSDDVKREYFNLLSFLRHAKVSYPEEPEGFLENLFEPILPVRELGHALVERLA